MKLARRRPAASCAVHRARSAAPTEVKAEYKVVHQRPLIGARVQESYVRKGDTYTIQSKSARRRRC